MAKTSKTRDSRLKRKQLNRVQGDGLKARPKLFPPVHPKRRYQSEAHLLALMAALGVLVGANVYAANAAAQERPEK